MSWPGISAVSFWPAATGNLCKSWAERLAPACDRRDLSRLQQLVEMAYGFQTRGTLRADDFVDHVQVKRVPDPSTADVRVMTIHGAKGLEFDVVVLPELDVNLAGLTPAFVVGRDKTSLDVNLVCRYAEEAVRNLLTDTERAAFEQGRQGIVEEQLSLLYVAMTRAIYALHIFIPGPRRQIQSKGCLAQLASANAGARSRVGGKHIALSAWRRQMVRACPSASGRHAKPRSGPASHCISGGKNRASTRDGADRTVPARRPRADRLGWIVSSVGRDGNGGGPALSCVV